MGGSLPENAAGRQLTIRDKPALKNFRKKLYVRKNPHPAKTKLKE